MRAYRGEGALTLAFVGREESPLAGAAEAVLPLHLGGAEGAGFLALVLLRLRVYLEPPGF